MRGRCRFRPSSGSQEARARRICAVSSDRAHVRVCVTVLAKVTVTSLRLSITRVPGQLAYQLGAGAKLFRSQFDQSLGGGSECLRNCRIVGHSTPKEGRGGVRARGSDAGRPSCTDLRAKSTCADRAAACVEPGDRVSPDCVNKPPPATAAAAARRMPNIVLSLRLVLQKGSIKAAAESQLWLAMRPPLSELLPENLDRKVVRLFGVRLTWQCYMQPVSNKAVCLGRKSRRKRLCFFLCRSLLSKPLPSTC